MSTILHIEDAQRVARDPNKVRKPDIIDKYSCYSSGVYAPMQREGRFPDTRPVDQRIDTRPFQPNSYAELLELEASLPQRKLLAKVQVGAVHCKLISICHLAANDCKTAENNRKMLRNILAENRMSIDGIVRQGIDTRCL